MDKNTTLVIIALVGLYLVMNKAEAAPVTTPAANPGAPPPTPPKEDSVFGDLIDLGNNLLKGFMGRGADGTYTPPELTNGEDTIDL